MWIKGKIVKSGKFWVVNIPAVDYATQGRTKREAYGMAKDLLETLADSAGFKINVTHKMTLREAAERLGAKSVSAYARYEQGKSDPTLTMMDRLISAAGEADSLAVKFGGGARVA